MYGVAGPNQASVPEATGQEPVRQLSKSFTRDSDVGSRRIGTLSNQSSGVRQDPNLDLQVLDATAADTPEPPSKRTSAQSASLAPPTAPPDPPADPSQPSLDPAPPSRARTPESVTSSRGAERDAAAAAIPAPGASPAPGTAPPSRTASGASLAVLAPGGSPAPDASPPTGLFSGLFQGRSRTPSGSSPGMAAAVAGDTGEDATGTTSGTITTPVTPLLESPSLDLSPKPQQSGGGNTGGGEVEDLFQPAGSARGAGGGGGTSHAAPDGDAQAEDEADTFPPPHLAPSASPLPPPSPAFPPPPPAGYDTVSPPSVVSSESLREPTPLSLRAASPLTGTSPNPSVTRGQYRSPAPSTPGGGPDLPSKSPQRIQFAAGAEQAGAGSRLGREPAAGGAAARAPAVVAAGEAAGEKPDVPASRQSSMTALLIRRKSSVLRRELEEKAQAVLMLTADTRAWLHVDKYGSPLRTKPVIPEDDDPYDDEPGGGRGGWLAAWRRRRSTKVAPEEPDKDKEEQQVHDPDWKAELNVYRGALWTLMTDPGSTRAAMWMSWLVMGTIVLSTLCFCLETVPAYSEERSPGSHRAFVVIEAVTVQIFLADYLLRLVSCPALLPFLVHPLNIIDLVSIVPWYVELGLAESGLQGTAVFRVLRLLRVFRVLKLGGRYRKLLVVTSSLAASADMLLLLVFFVSLIVVIGSSLIYFAERGSYDAALGYYVRNNEKYTQADGDPIVSPFESIPSGFWWAIVTLMTVGYGDVVPISLGGRFIACATMLCGILFIALPVAVIGSNFSSAWKAYLQTKSQAKREVSPLLGVLQELLGDFHATMADLRAMLEQAVQQVSDLRATYRDLEDQRRHRVEGLVRQWAGVLSGRQVEAARTVVACLRRLGGDSALDGPGDAAAAAEVANYTLPPLLAALMTPPPTTQSYGSKAAAASGPVAEGREVGNVERVQRLVLGQHDEWETEEEAEGQQRQRGSASGGWVQQQGAGQREASLSSEEGTGARTSQASSRVAFAPPPGGVGAAASAAAGLGAAAAAAGRGTSLAARAAPSVSGLPTGVLMLRAISARHRTSARVAPGSPAPPPDSAAAGAPPGTSQLVLMGAGGGAAGPPTPPTATAGVRAPATTQPPATPPPPPPSSLPPSAPPPAPASLPSPPVAKRVSDPATAAAGAAAAVGATAAAPQDGPAGGRPGGGGGAREAWGPEQYEEPEAQADTAAKLRRALETLRGTPLHAKMIGEVKLALEQQDEEEVNRQWQHLVQVLYACALMSGDYLPETLDVMRSQFRQLALLGREASELRQQLEVMDDQLSGAHRELGQGPLDPSLDRVSTMGSRAFMDALAAASEPDGADRPDSGSSRGSGNGRQEEEEEDWTVVRFNAPPADAPPPPVPPELAAAMAMLGGEGAGSFSGDTPVAEPLPRVSVLPSRGVSRAGPRPAPDAQPPAASGPTLLD